MAKISEITLDLAGRVDYPLDGMVAEVTNDNVKKHMGSTNHHHRWQTAIKSEGEVKETTVLDIGWQTGRTGKITPVLRLETVEVDGANISNVTAHHAGNVQSLKLGKGAKVEIIRSGGVIPKLKSVIKTCSHDIPDAAQFVAAMSNGRMTFYIARIMMLVLHKHKQACSTFLKLSKMHKRVWSKNFRGSW